jgi:hypothetical protein
MKDDNTMKNITLNRGIFAWSQNFTALSPHLATQSFDAPIECLKFAF